MNDPQRYQRAKSIFFDACDRHGEEREAFVNGACHADNSLREQVLRLLRQDDDPMTLGSGAMRERLAQLADASTGGAARDQGLVADMPERIGGYRILGVLGAGGMGVVYLAEQDHPRRQVALKVIGSGQIGEQALRRFTREAQVLGLLQHPGIAQIHEAGAYDSLRGRQPFFVMEYVRGRPLLAHLDHARADVRARLEMFIKVCEAIDYAHRQAVVHRDIKPANILVDETTPTPQPKLLDFGVARLMDQDDRGASLNTQADQLIGTMAYMSPEQLLGRRQEIDARSDVFALGVVLFEMLSRRLPHDLSNRTMADAIRMLSEREPVTLSSVSGEFRGDLDTITAKALERDRARRYATAGELAADVRRFLNHEPILARPPSTTYKMRKFAQRHRAPVAGAAAVFLVLVAGLAATAWQARLAIAARDQQKELRKLADASAALARDEADRALASRDFLRQMLSSANPDFAQGRDIMVSDVLAAASSNIDGGELASEPDVQAYVHLTIGETYRSIGRLTEAQSHLESALAIARREPGAHPDDEAAALSGLSLVYAINGDIAGALKLSQEALMILRAVYGDADRADVAECLTSLSDLASSQGGQSEAIDLRRQTLAMLRRLKGDDDVEVAQQQARLASMLHDPYEAEPLVKSALATFERMHGESSPSYVTATRTLADLATMRGSFAEAVPIYQRALELGTRVYGRDHHRNLLTLQNLAFCHRLAQDTQRFSDVTDQVIDMSRRMYGNDSMRVAESLIERADVRAMLRRDAESEADYREVMAITERLGQQNDGRACIARVSVAAMVIRRDGDLTEPETLARSVLALRESFKGQQAWCIGQALSLLGEIALRRGQLNDAEDLCQQAYQQLSGNSLVRAQRQATAQRMQRVYEAMETASPGQGFAAKAERWRAEAASTGKSS